MLATPELLATGAAGASVLAGLFLGIGRARIGPLSGPEQRWAAVAFGLLALSLVVEVGMRSYLFGATLAFAAAGVLGAGSLPRLRAARTERAPASSGPWAADLLTLGILFVSAIELGWVGTASGFGSGPSGSGGFSVLLSPSFVLPGAAALAALTLLGATEVDRRLQALLLLWSLSLGMVGLLGALPAASGSVVALGYVTGSIVLLQFLYRQKQLPASVSAFLLRWALLSAVLSAGTFLWLLDGRPEILAAGVVATLGAGLYTVLRAPPVPSEPRPSWLMQQFWTFQLLLYTFVGEFFVGATLDLVISGPQYLQYIPFLRIEGAPLPASGVAIYDGLWFAAAILASSWFLVAFGGTMGALAIFRIREVHHKAQKYRLGLMIGVFALAAVYLPSFASSTPLPSIPALQAIPVIGWGFGLRTGGPFSSGLFIAILGMYATVGILTTLFGRRALCSVMCGAALVYQGTTVNEMRSFNQTSRIGRYFLGSQLSTAYTIAASLALVSLASISLLAGLHLLPTVQVTNGEFDTAALPLPVELYFGAIWFVMFVSVPYLGTYNCATTGICHWGTLSALFTKTSFFRLKARDRAVCEACTTFDCAKSCPVGLVDMPYYLRTTGVYRSSKCCGVGDCIGACPYGNLYHVDVRDWLRRLTGRSPSTPEPTARLPMLSTRAPVAAATGAPGIRSAASLDLATPRPEVPVPNPG